MPRKEKTMKEQVDEKKTAVKEPGVEVKTEAVKEPEPKAEASKDADGGAKISPPAPKVESPASMSDQIGKRRKFRTEMRVENRIPDAIVHPRIQGGVVESDGKPLSESEYYQGVDIRCTYCGKGEEIIQERTLRIFSLKTEPDVLIVVCDDYGCEFAHNKRFPRVNSRMNA